MKINEIIREKRKEKNLTQEQMASYLGVSAPAVNKWESGASFPDITLLPPIARLLGTDLNTLLSFKEDLSKQEIGLIVNEISSIMQEKGFPAGFDAAMDKLQEFPSCDILLYNLAAVLNGALFVFPPENPQLYEDQITELFERASRSENWQVKNEATAILISLTYAKGDYEKANALLDSYSDPLSVDKSLLRANLYIRQEKYNEACALLEQKLLKAATDICNTLVSLSEIAVKEGRLEDARLCSRLSSQTAQSFYLMGCMELLPHFLLAAAEKDIPTCIHTLDALLQSMLQDRWDINQTPLYKHIKGKNQETSFSTSMAAAFIRQLPTDPEMEFLHGNPDFQKLMEKYSPC